MYELRIRWVDRCSNGTFKFPSHCFSFLGEVVISPWLNVRVAEKVLKV